MSSGLIFITGATGFIGGATAQEALKTGYRLRIAVRKEAQIEKLKGILSDYREKLEFTVVPDITQESAFSGKLDGADYVLHLASPLAPGPDKEQVFPPAVNGTTAILNEAAKVSSIKKVVITSSIAALIPIGGLPRGGIIKEDNGWDLSVDPESDFTAENDAATTMRVYQASKLLAHQASLDFMTTEKPHFSLATIHPAFVYGHNVVQLTPEELLGSTNGMFFSSIMSGVPIANNTYVHIQDVAEAHVKALHPRIKSGSAYLLAGPKMSWRDVVEILQRDYPNVDWKIKADTPGASWPTDTTKAETDLGMKWRSVEKVVQEVMDQQLDLIKQKGSAAQL